jgi:4-alpha-glucanotransferase
MILFPIAYREPDALKKFSTDHKQAIEEFVAVQFLFDRQWKAIRV